MEVNIVKMWRKNNMIKDMKINLLLGGACWNFRHVAKLIFAG